MRKEKVATGIEAAQQKSRFKGLSSDKSGREIDALDQQIIDALRSDPRITNKALAEQLASNEITIAARIRALENDCVMRVMAQRDFRTVGGNVLALVDVNVLGRSAHAVAEDLAKCEQVGSVTLLLGEPSIICLIHAADPKELQGLILNTISKIKGIHSLSSNIVVDILKYQSALGDLRA